MFYEIKYLISFTVSQNTFINLNSVSPSADDKNYKIYASFNP